jgi:flagellar hook-length control protein FliK
VALDIRPSSGASSSSTSGSSSRKSSSTDLFAQGMAAAARQTKPTRQAAPAPKAGKPAKPATAKPKHTADDSDQPKSNAAAKSGGATSAEPESSASSQAAPNAQSGQDGSSPDDAATASEANTVATGAKGRPAARTAPRNSATQDPALKNAEDVSTDPGADSASQSGLSLLQLLAQSLASDDAADETTSTDAAAPAATGKADAADGTDTASGDPNAIALAMFSQALAAALSRQASPNAAPANTDEATTAIGSATESPGGAASLQDLMTVLAHDVAADAKGKSDDAAAQFNVDTTKGAASGASSTDSSAASPNAMSHLGVASHFAAQHLRNDTNTADLKSPVGSSAWEDELGAHLTWMTQKGLETGSLRVSPEHLGPVEVNISVQNGDASVWFAANHPDTRAALEQALPRLREMFASQGMNLADSGVSRQSLSQQGSRNQSRQGPSQGISGVSAIGASDGSSTASGQINLGLVDLYA